MKILTICYEYPPVGGGGAKVVQGLVQGLVSKGHMVDLVTMRYAGLPKEETTERFRIFRAFCWRVHPDRCSPLEMVPYLISAWILLRKLCKANRYDLIHAHFILPDGILARLLHKPFNLPYVITAHGSDVPGYNPDRFTQLHKLLFPLWQWVVKPAATIAFPSRTLESLANRQSLSFPAVIIPNGFDQDRYSADRPKQKRLLVVTRMFERKGVQYLIRALAGISPEVSVTVVGDGPYLKSLQSLAAELGVAIDFPGHLDNNSPQLKELYETSRIFVLPSEAENFPMVLLEAMAAGLAIITTSDTGCAEVVGDTALLVAPGDIDGLRDALQLLLADAALCQRKGRAARQRLDANFGWPAISERYLKLFQDVSLKASQPEGN